VDDRGARFETLQADVDVFCFYSQDEQGGFYISPEVSALLSKHNITLVVDIYLADEAPQRDDASQGR
jgi:ethanolamine utilization protein EutP (predicted NTPase)